MKATKQYLDQLTYRIIGAAIEVHKEIGPGLLESIYHQCLQKEFLLRGIKCESELRVDVNYKGEKLSTALRCDFLVEDLVVIELKAVDGIIPIHEAQLLTYMKLLKKPQGILINFNSYNIFHHGQKSYVN